MPEEEDKIPEEPYVFTAEGACRYDPGQCLENEQEADAMLFLANLLKNASDLEKDGKKDFSMGCSSTVGVFAACNRVLEKMGDLLTASHRRIHEQEIEIASLQKMLSPYVESRTGRKTQPS